MIYWQVPKTGTLDTTIGKTMGKKRYKSSTTTRNLRTLDKVLDLAWSRFTKVSSQERARWTVAVLTGVSETALLTLRVRATEARRPDGDHRRSDGDQTGRRHRRDYGKFGPPTPGHGAARPGVRQPTRGYLVDHRRPRCRARRGPADEFLPPRRRAWAPIPVAHRRSAAIIELRERLLPQSDRVSACAQSALDYSWMDRVDDTDGVFITAEGLLMYLQPADALG